MIGALVAIALAFTAFAAQASVHAIDDHGNDVVLQAPAARIVTLSPNAAELVASAGAAERIVGVIKGTDEPAVLRSRPVVGDVNGLDLERIVALAPDLVVTWPWTTPAQVELLRRRGIGVFVVDPATIDAIAADIASLGTLTATEGTARDQAARFLARVRDVEAHARHAPALRVFYEISDTPLFTLGGRHLVSQAIERCGGENVFAQLTIPAPQVGLESVLAANPQVIVAGSNGARRPAWLDAWSRWPALDAVKHRALYVVDANLLHRPGPRFVDGMAQLCAALANAREAYRSDAYGRAGGRTVHP